MTPISAISAYSSTQPAHATGPVDPDQDGDNDANASEAVESSRGPATNVTLSPQAQSLLASQKA
jgi:hypothetical protein